MAFLTRRLFLSLGLAVGLGAVLSTMTQSELSPNTLWQIIESLVQVVWSAISTPANAIILCFVTLILVLTNIIMASGGLQAFVLKLQTFVRGPRTAQMATTLLGFFVFIDDYANTMIVGPTMRGLTDRFRISREKLAFIIDATSAPVAGIALVSTWVGYEVGMFSELSQSLGWNQNGYEIFLQALSYRFYCYMMLIFVLLSCFLNFDFGPMKKAQLRAANEGLLSAPDAKPLTQAGYDVKEPHPNARLSLLAGLGPILLLLFCVLFGLWLDGGFDNSNTVLAVSALVAVFAATLLAKFEARLNWNDILTPGVQGVKASLLPAAILVLAWSLKTYCDQLGTGPYIAAQLKDVLVPQVLPLLTFIVAALTAFATGTSWGTMAILLPTLGPVAHAIDGHSFGLITPMVLAAVLDGAIMGDHCSPISDTTIMSSLATGCDHVHHVRTQLPYGLLIGTLAGVLGYLGVAVLISGG